MGATLTLAIIPSHTLTLPIIPSVGLDSVPLLVGSMCVEDRAALAPKLEARRYADQEVIVAAGDWVHSAPRSPSRPALRGEQTDESGRVGAVTLPPSGPVSSA